MSPKEVICPTCEALPGAPCFDLSQGMRLPFPIVMYHVKRIEAMELSNSPLRAENPDFDKKNFGYER